MQFIESVNSVKNKNLITKFFMSGNIDKIIDFTTIQIYQFLFG